MTRLPALAIANLALLGAMGLHALDHAGQDRGVGALSTEVLLGGILLFALAAVSLALSMRGSAVAPRASLAVGLTVAAGVAASHLAPHWSAFSDPYADLSLPWYSWAAALLELAVALGLAAVGAAAPRRRVATAPAVAPHA